MRYHVHQSGPRYHRGEAKANTKHHLSFRQAAKQHRTCDLTGVFTSTHTSRVIPHSENPTMLFFGLGGLFYGMTSWLHTSPSYTDMRSRGSAHQRRSNSLRGPLSSKKYDYCLILLECNLASIREHDQLNRSPQSSTQPAIFDPTLTRYI